jgi:hypothetical protein
MKPSLRKTNRELVRRLVGALFAASLALSLSGCQQKSAPTPSPPKQPNVTSKSYADVPACPAVITIDIDPQNSGAAAVDVPSCYAAKGDTIDWKPKDPTADFTVEFDYSPFKTGDKKVSKSSPTHPEPIDDPGRKKVRIHPYKVSYTIGSNTYTLDPQIIIGGGN